MKRLCMKLGVLAAVMLMTSNTTVRADEFDAVRAKIKAALVEEQVPSLAVAVARGGEIVWEEGFGWADRENRVRANEHTMYSLASITKPITATGIMVLVERGQLKLDKPANKYLGESKLKAHVGKVKRATLRRLANHTSGLPLHYQFFYEDQPLRRPPMDKSIRRYGQLVAAPGERYQYANLGYGVLDHIIERKSGMSYAEFMRREVFLPLGMTHTSVGIDPGLGAFEAVRYAMDHTPLPFYDFDHPGASAVYSSAHDLVRFGMFHQKHRGEDQKSILSDESIDEMHRPTADMGGGMGYGVGWAVNPDEFGVKTVSHTGGMGGVRTRLTLVPDEDIVVVALCNYSTQLPLRMTNEILAAMLPTYEKKLRAHEEAQQPLESAQKPEPFEPPETLAGHWIGEVSTYQGTRRLELWVKPCGDIHVRFNGHLVTLLNEPQFRDGRLSGVFAGGIGTTDADRRPYHLHLDVQLRGDVLNGSLTAISLPGNRAGNALSYWVEIEKQPALANRDEESNSR